MGWWLERENGDKNGFLKMGEIIYLYIVENCWELFGSKGKIVNRGEKGENG